jgi:hypothetical protein
MGAEALYVLAHDALPKLMKYMSYEIIEKPLQCDAFLPLYVSLLGRNVKKCLIERRFVTLLRRLLSGDRLDPSRQSWTAINK